MTIIDRIVVDTELWALNSVDVCGGVYARRRARESVGWPKKEKRLNENTK